MPYDSGKYEYLFDLVPDEDALRRMRDAHKGGIFYRTQTITAGNTRICKIYPVWDTKSEIRSARAHVTTEAQKRQNEKCAKMRLIGRMNANFTEEDYHVTLTYRDGYVPDEQQARIDVRNYFRRVKAWRKKNGLPPLKYIYVIEFGNGDGRRTRAHHHIVMSGGVPREVLKDLWKFGSVRVDELEPENGTLEGLARYITKAPCGSKRWECSRNLINPKITESDTKVSKRRAYQMACDFEEAPQDIFRKLYPDWEFSSCTVKASGFVAGVYITAKMHKKELKTNGARNREKNRISCGKDHG